MWKNLQEHSRHLFLFFSGYTAVEGSVTAWFFVQRSLSCWRTLRIYAGSRCSLGVRGTGVAMLENVWRSCLRPCLFFVASVASWLAFTKFCAQAHIARHLRRRHYRHVIVSLNSNTAPDFTFETALAWHGKLLCFLNATAILNLRSLYNSAIN